MKFTPEVIAALQTLKDHAENDFERHRIDVLERDLIALPVAEVIDETHQRFNGEIYRPNKYGRYTTAPKYLSREIFSYYYGDIPDGYEIHHRNENKADNNISNLQMLTKPEHMALHGKNKAIITRFVCKECGKIFYAPKTVKNFFCSPACRSAWRRHNGVDDIEKVCAYCGKAFTTNKYEDNEYCSIACANRATAQPPTSENYTKIFICEVCGKEFSAFNNGHNRFCSAHCKAVHRYRSGKENEIRCCVICGAEFTVNKYSKTKTCSRHCAGIMRESERRSKKTKS